MKHKKIVSLLLAIMLLAGLMTWAHAAGNTTVSISSGEVRAGESITLTVSIKDNPGLAGLMLYIYYDTSVFTASKGDIKAVGTFGEQGSISRNTIQSARQNGAYEGDPTKDGLIALWYDPFEENAGNGEVFTVTLHANASAPDGTYPITLGFSEKNTIRRSNELVPLTLVNGSVTLSGGEAEDGEAETPSAPGTGEETGSDVSQESVFESWEECLRSAIVLKIGDYAALSWGNLFAIDPDNHDVTPIIRDDRTLVPVRYVAESLGADVDWDNDTRSVVITLGDKTVVMPVGSREYTINGVTHTMDTAPVIEPGWDRTLVPIRFVAEALGMEVEWDKDHRLVLITIQGKPWNLNGAVEARATTEAMMLMAMKSFL